MICFFENHFSQTILQEDHIIISNKGRLCHDFVATGPAKQIDFALPPVSWLGFPCTPSHLRKSPAT